MAGQNSATPSSTWTVDSQTEQVQGGAQGIVRGVLISFTTGQQNKGTVFLADDRYSVAAARDAIAARAALLDSVSQLSSE